MLAQQEMTIPAEQAHRHHLRIPTVMTVQLLWADNHSIYVATHRSDLLRERRVADKTILLAFHGH